jgi:hypothetical protein
MSDEEEAENAKTVEHRSDESIDTAKQKATKS